MNIEALDLETNISKEIRVRYYNHREILKLIKYNMREGVVDYLQRCTSNGCPHCYLVSLVIMISDVLNNEEIDISQYEKSVENTYSINYGGVYNNIGWYYQEKNDEYSMMHWYMLAIRTGNKMSMNNIIKYYDNKKDYNKVLFYARKYYENGLDGIAQNAAGACYVLNRYQECIEWSLKIEGNYPVLAYWNIAQCYNKLEDKENTIKYIKMGADKGDTKAMIKLYSAGLIKDYEERWNYLVQACVLGDESGINRFKADVINLTYSYTQDLLDKISIIARICQLHDYYPACLLPVVETYIDRRQEVTEGMIHYLLNIDLDVCEPKNLGIFKAYIKMLRTRFDEMELHFKYAPGGEGFETAKNHYVQAISFDVKET